MTQQEFMEILADPQVLNSYSYARNNPLAIKDPEGTFILTLIVLGIKANGWYDTVREYQQLKSQLKSDGNLSLRIMPSSIGM